MAVFWDVAPYSPVQNDVSFRDVTGVHQQGDDEGRKLVSNFGQFVAHFSVQHPLHNCRRENLKPRIRIM